MPLILPKIKPGTHVCRSLQSLPAIPDTGAHTHAFRIKYRNSTGYCQLFPSWGWRTRGWRSSSYMAMRKTQQGTSQHRNCYSKLQRHCAGRKTRINQQSGHLYRLTQWHQDLVATWFAGDLQDIKWQDVSAYIRLNLGLNFTCTLPGIWLTISQRSLYTVALEYIRGYVQTPPVEWTVISTNTTQNTQIFTRELVTDVLKPATTSYNPKAEMPRLILTSMLVA